jgi:hypothetical protein
MALLAEPVTARDVVITLEDATGTPIVCTVQFEEGDLSIDGFEQGNAPVNWFRDRGVIYAGRLADEEPISISFSCDANEITDATEKLVSDALNKTGAFASGVSTWGANAEIWTVKMTVTIERTNFGGASDDVFTFDYFRGKAAWAEGDRARWTISGVAVPKNGAGITRA